MPPDRWGLFLLTAPEPVKLASLKQELTDAEALLSHIQTRADGTKDICGLKKLDAYFGGRHLADITSDDVEGFIKQRQDEGAGPAIINRSNALLRRMLKLMWRKKKLRAVIWVPMLKEPEPREGFLAAKKFAELESAMQEDLRPVLYYLYITGCRSGAAEQIEWSQVIFDGDKVEILLRAAQMKNKEPLLLALDEKLAAPLRQTPKEKRVGRLFNTTNLTKAFRKACVAVGLGQWRDPKNHDKGYDGLTLHDLRRSGVRNLRRAKVQEDMAMKISGHKTANVFKRYNIIDSDDLHEAMQKTSAYVANSLQIGSDASRK
ncbi:MAG: tyrosine-type recombinase/integrase [Candidatus Sulfotelmatobacter sp.]